MLITLRRYYDERYTRFAMLLRDTIRDTLYARLPIVCYRIGTRERAAPYAPPCCYTLLLLMPLRCHADIRCYADAC